MIKYRAISKQSGEFTYGYYAKLNHTPYMISYDSRLTEIVPDSITYLIGYDKNGEEIYNLDIVEINGEEIQTEASIEVPYSTNNSVVKLRYKGECR